MLEMNDELQRALHEKNGEPLRLFDPSTQKTFILLSIEEFERLADDEVDYGPWTQEEMDLLAAENADMLGWEGMEKYQDM